MKRALFFFFVVVVAAGVGCCFAQRTEFSFDTDVEGWTRVGSNLTVTWAAAAGRSGGALRVTGFGAEGSWNYARSPSINITAGLLYRLSGWIFISSSMVPPYFKIEFTGSYSGRASTTKYDLLEGVGVWQRVYVEFGPVPAGVTGAWLALEKGTTTLVRIDALVDDVVVEEISEVDPWYAYPMADIGVLAPVRDVHPRLFFSSRDVQNLKETLEDSTWKSLVWDTIFSTAWRYSAVTSPPEYDPNPTSDGNMEQLWQRPVGNAMPFMALAWMLTGNSTYLEGALAWALKSCSYPTWGLGASYNFSDLAAAHQLLGLALVYDWCFDAMPPSAKQIIRETLVFRTSYMAQRSASGAAWWRNAYMQNHQWVDTNSIGTVALALFDDESEEVQNLTRHWITLTQDTFKRARSYLGDDGASHEGVGYWEYGAEYMMKWYHLSKTLLGDDLWEGSEWWKQTALYSLHTTLPRASWKRSNSAVDFGDCPRYHWYGPSYLLHGLASYYNDQLAQWLGNEVALENIFSNGAGWLDAVWYKHELPTTSPAIAHVPTLHHFDDIGIVASRSSWSGNESVVWAKCGPPLGHHFAEMPNFVPGTDVGSGHVHPDAGHFNVVHRGEWLLIDDGYVDIKTSVFHNTLVINTGSAYEGQCTGRYCYEQVEKGLPHIPKALSTDQLDYVIMNATAAYRTVTSVRVENFVRHLLFLKKHNTIIVVDDIATNAIAGLELLFHTENALVAGNGNNVVHANGTTVWLRAEALTVSSGVALSFGSMDLLGVNFPQNTIRLAKSANSWRNAMVFSWSDRDMELSVVSLESTGNTWTFTVSGSEFVFDWTTGEFAVEQDAASSNNGDDDMASKASSMAACSALIAVVASAALVF